MYRSKVLSVAAALLMAACIAWAAVVNGGGHEPLERIASSWRGLQPDGRRLQNWRQRRRNRNRNKNNKNKNSSGGGGGGGGNNNAASTVDTTYANIAHDKWKQSNGLQLKVWNNMKSGSAWMTALRATVQDWNRSPSVQLSMYRPSFDSKCSPKVGIIKACNGSFGQVGWKGVNHAYIHQGNIVASVMKMNDSYSTDAVEKQYTSCHEMGHAIGLKHADENFSNKDLYNCMDYTRNHGNNKSPSQMNYLALKKLYGAARRLRTGKMDASDAEKLADEELERLFDEVVEKVGPLSEDYGVPRYSSQKGWRMLSQTDHHEEHEMELGKGFTLRTTVLRA